MRESGLSAIHQGCGQAADKADAPPCDRFRSNRGFTLAELAVVVFIIALAMSLTIPLLGKTGDADLRSAGRRLAGTIKYLYNEAALASSNHRLTFDLDHAVYYAARQEPSGEWVPLPGRRAKNTLPGSVTLKQIKVNGRQTSSGEVSVQIYPVGWVDETILHLQDGGHQLTLRVSALTGVTEFFDGHRDFK